MTESQDWCQDHVSAQFKPRETQMRKEGTDLTSWAVIPETVVCADRLSPWNTSDPFTYIVTPGIHYAAEWPVRAVQ